jgi:hypothetical protein
MIGAHPNVSVCVLRVRGFALAIDRVPDFRKVCTGRGRPFYVAESLWRLPLEVSFAKVQPPRSVNWSSPGSSYNLADCRQRSRCYEIVLRLHIGSRSWISMVGNGEAADEQKFNAMGVE